MTDFYAPDNVADEFSDYIALSDVPELLKRTRKVTAETVYRWARKGLHGVHLRYHKVGAKKFTRRRWLADFFRETAETEARQYKTVTSYGGRQVRVKNSHGL